MTMRLSVRPRSVSARVRLGIEELECRTQPAAFTVTGLLGPAADPPALPAALSTPAALTVLALPAMTAFAPAGSFTQVEFLFISVPGASESSSGGGGQSGSSLPPLAAANPTVPGAPAGQQQSGSSTTVVFVDIFTVAIPIARGGPAADSPHPAMVVIPPAGAGEATPGSDPGTTPLIPTHPTRPPGSGDTPGVGMVGDSHLPPVVYRGEYPTLRPVAPAPREVPAPDAPAPQNDAAPEIAPPPRLVGRAEILQAAAVQPLVAAASTTTTTGDAPAEPAPAAETSSVWGWVAAATAVVTTGYWAASRYWQRRSLAVRRAVVRFWCESLFPTDLVRGRRS